MKKTIVMALAITLVLGIAVGGTLAWLVDTTAPVVNTFTYGDINITLTETDSGLDNDGNVNTNAYKMVPGNTITKDPEVTVEANSEACWLFVKIEKSANFDDFMTYAIAAGWTALDGEDGVYCRSVDAESAKNGVSYWVLKDNAVVVKTSVTKDMLNAGYFVAPTLTFTAYAVQSANITSVDAAWAAVSNPTDATTPTT